MKKNFMFYVLSGLGIGFPVTLACMTLIGGFNAVIGEFLVWMVASALFGLLSGLIFDRKNEMNLPAALALHCLGCLIVAVSAAAICGYADDFLSLLTGILPVFVIVYALIYGFCFLSMKINEKRINKELNKE